MKNTTTTSAPTDLKEKCKAIPFVADLSVRDYFAANASEQDVALQGEVIREKLISAHGIGILPDNWRPTARYMHADAMLAERNK